MTKQCYYTDPTYIGWNIVVPVYIIEVMSGIYSTLKRLSKTALHTNDELERRYTLQVSAKDLFQRLLEEGESLWFSQQTQSQSEIKEMVEPSLFLSPMQTGCAQCGRIGCQGIDCCLTDNISQCGPLCYCALCLIRSVKQTATKSQTQEIGLLNGKSVRCKCKHSGCVKRYCQCYKLGQECGKDCGCHDCGNKGHENKETRIIEEC